jgi:hypothetical protein
MPRFLEIAVAFVEMSDSSFGFEPVQPKQTKLIPSGNTFFCSGIYGCIIKPNLLC